MALSDWGGKMRLIINPVRVKIYRYRRSAAAVARYNKRHYQQIIIRVPIGTRDTIKEAAKQNGESLNSFIYDAIMLKIIKMTKKDTKKG